MRLLFLIIVSLYFVVMPQSVYAMDTGISFTTSSEGWMGEVWYDHTLLWQLVLCSSDAVPASTTGGAAYRTYLLPEFKNGLFLVRVNP